MIWWNNKEEILIKYYGIHVTTGKNSGGYTVPIAVNDNETENEAIVKAKQEQLFEFENDINNVDYVEEVTEEEYMLMSQYYE